MPTEINYIDVAISGGIGAVAAPAVLAATIFVPQTIPILATYGYVSAVKNHSDAQAEMKAGHKYTAENLEVMAYLDLFGAGIFHSTSRPPSSFSPAFANGAASILNAATAAPSFLAGAGAGLIGSNAGDLFQHFFASNGDSGGDGFPRPREEDVDGGPHAWNRDIEDVFSRSKVQYEKNKEGKLVQKKGTGPQGIWLNKQAAYDAVKDLDVEKMNMHEPYTVPIPPKQGAVVRPNKVYPERVLEKDERFNLDPADRAVVIKKPDGIHTFPIGREHLDYNKQAPTR